MLSVAHELASIEVEEDDVIVRSVILSLIRDVAKAEKLARNRSPNAFVL